MTKEINRKGWLGMVGFWAFVLAIFAVALGAVVWVLVDAFN